MAFDYPQSRDSQEITISFTGDVALGTYQGASINVIEKYKDNGYGYYFNNVADIFKNDDITFVNLEGPLTAPEHTQVVQKTFPVKGELDYVNILTAASVDICNLANNHINDCGDVGLRDTINVLAANNIKTCGEGTSSIISCKGINVGFLGYQAWADTIDLRNTIKEDIKTLKSSGADIIIIQYHWGIERKNIANQDQINIAHYTIDSGADVVIGNHPHVIQGIEHYNGAPIVYSMGNFCFGLNSNPKDKDTFIYQQKIKINNDGTFSLAGENIIPCSISSDMSTNNMQPTILSGKERERVLTRIKQYS